MRSRASVLVLMLPVIFSVRRPRSRKLIETETKRSQTRLATVDGDPTRIPRAFDPSRSGREDGPNRPGFQSEQFADERAGVAAEDVMIGLAEL